MNKIAITDFFLKLGFDPSEVKKGIKNLEKEFKPLQQKLTKEAVNQNRLQKKKNDGRVKEYQILTKRLTLEKNIDRVRKATVNNNYEKAKRRAKQASAQDTIDTRRIGFQDSLKNVSHALNSANMDSRFSQNVGQINKQLAALNKQASTAKTRKEFALLRSELKDVARSSRAVLKANSAMRRDMKASEFAAASLKDSMRNLSRSYLSLFAVMGATVSFVRTGQELTSLKATLLGVSGTAEGAAQDFEFVSDASKTLGVDLTEATSAYGKLGAAAKSAGLTQADARNAFLATAEMATAFNLSAADMEGVSRAMSQILAKGKLSTEELLQLGERVPIAFSSAAKALNVTTEELYKKIETGQVRSAEFLPKFADEVRKYVRETNMLDKSLDTSRVAMNRLVTTYKMNVETAFNKGLDSGLGEFFNSLSNIMEELSPVFEIFGDVLGGIMQVIGPVLSAAWQLVRLIVNPIVGAFNSLSTAMDKPLDKMNFFEKALRAVLDGFKTLAAGILYPFALLEEGLDSLDRWFAGSPSGAASGMGGAGATGNTTTTNQNVEIVIDGAKNPQEVGREVQMALEQQFAKSFAGGY